MKPLSVTIHMKATEQYSLCCTRWFSLLSLWMKSYGVTIHVKLLSAVLSNVTISFSTFKRWNLKSLLNFVRITSFRLPDTFRNVGWSYMPLNKKGFKKLKIPRNIFDANTLVTSLKMPRQSNKFPLSFCFRNLIRKLASVSSANTS